MELEKMRAERKELREQARRIVAVADDEKRELTVEEHRAFEDTMTRHDQLDARVAREERLQAAETEANRSYRAPTKPEVGTPDMIPGQPQRFRSFGEQLQAVIRAGQPGGQVDPRLNLRAVLGMSEGSPSDGGFLVQTDFATELLTRVYSNGALAQRCNRKQITNGANSMKINAIAETSRADGSRWGGVRAYWTAEGGDKTNATPAFRQIELNLKKLTGLAYVTDELLEDAGMLGQILTAAFTDEFAFKLDDAIMRGTGAGQPLGILAAPCLVTESAEGGQPADTIVTENVMKMYSRLWAGSLRNAVWLINQSCWPQLMTLSLDVGTGGQALFAPGGNIAGAPFGTLLGLPLVPTEVTDTIGDLGDIVLADLSQYILADKGGIQSAISVHYRFINDESVFRFVYRVDGLPWWQSALTPYNTAPTQSPFVALAARA